MTAQGGDMAAIRTTRKGTLEIAKLERELQLDSLEISKLQRELRIPRLAEIFLDKWVPAIIAAVVLFTAVPLVNWYLWKSQKATEFYILILQKKMETYSDMASLATRFTQVVSLMNTNGCDQNKTSQTATERKAKSWCDDLVIERFQLEPKIVKALRDVKLYFSEPAIGHVDDLANYYNKSVAPLDTKFVDGFREKYRYLSEEMRHQIDQGMKQLR
jgi:hypothetical protein